MKILVLSFLSTLTIFSAQAMDCPVVWGTEDYLEKVSDLASSADSCWKASEIVNACALGAGGDVYTVSAAINRCLKDMPAMSKKDDESFKYLQKRCDDKYNKMEGSMYRSAKAFCYLAATKFYSDLLTPEESH